ncbi:hypothetical protein B7463_g1375, partial [Scytalidium lignicola]
MLFRLHHVVLAALTLGLGGQVGAQEWSAELVGRASSSGFTPSPLVVPPSQVFDGIDGQWSSLRLQVGTPAQDIRVLVSTSSAQTVLVALEGCTTAINGVIPSNCTASRGGIYNATASSTWNGQGLFPISENGAGLDGTLGFTEEAEYGMETIVLPHKGPSLNTQTVAVIISSTPLYIYTAGASYRFSGGQFAQLIFGGSDTSRYRSNPISFNMSSNAEQNLVVAIQSITYSANGDSSLLKDPIFAFIDSTDPNFWLPESACQAFEVAFGISRDPATGLYLLDSSTYDRISDMNPEVTFSLGTDLSRGQSMNITLPFNAFTLQASYPFIPNSTSKYYFPLRQTRDPSQYMLGRAFLQEAYITVDYDRSNFTVSQCIWEQSAPAQLVTILPPEFTTTAMPDSAGKSSSSSKDLSPGAIAGVVIGGIVALLATAVILLIIRRHRLKTKFAAVYNDISPYNDNPPVTRVHNGPVKKMHSGPLPRPRRTESTRVFPASIRGSFLSSISRNSSFGFPSMHSSSDNVELSSDVAVHQLSSQASTLLSTPHELDAEYFDHNTEYIGAGMTTESDIGRDGRRARVPFLAATNLDSADRDAFTPMMGPPNPRRWW